MTSDFVEKHDKGIPGFDSQGKFLFKFAALWGIRIV